MAHIDHPTGQLFYSYSVQTIGGEKSVRNPNIHLSQDLWIKKLAQDNSLQGESHQSRYSRHFYPRYYSPGDLQVSCIAPSQEFYQSVAFFIRRHQRTISSASSLNLGEAPFLHLQIPYENLYLKGVINKILLSKRGVFDPAPEFSFDFTILVDQSRSQDFFLSSAIKNWFDPNFGDPMDIQSNS